MTMKVITKMNSHSAQNVLLTKKNAEKHNGGEIEKKILYAEIACAISAYLRTRTQKLHVISAYEITREILKLTYAAAVLKLPGRASRTKTAR